MRYLSVCSGIEAATAAWHPIGWTPVAFAEVDAFPSAVLAHHYPGVPNWGDMTRYQDWPDADIDVLVGGTPCQSFSVAGLRAGLDDPRGQLVHAFAGIAARYRPEWLLWENVPGVLSSNDGRDFAGFVRGLVELGYRCAWRVLDAQYFGVAQRRRRVFLVGHARDWSRAAAVLFERASLRGDSAPSRGEGERAARPIAAGSERSSGYRNDADTADNLIARCDTAGEGKRQDYETCTLVGVDYTNGLMVGDVSGTLEAAQSKGNRGHGVIVHALTGEGFDASEDGTGRGTPLVPVPFDTTQITSAANYSSPRAGDPCHPLAAGAHPPAVAFNWQGGGKQTTLGANTLGANTTQAISHGPMVRRLTPRECERLQGFPDDFTLVPYRGKPAADGPRYKALGNSMAVPCMAWLGRRIAAVSAIPERAKESA